MTQSDPFRQLLLLKAAPAFSSVPIADLRVVAQELEEDTCYPGELVFEAGDPSDRMYIVSSGRVGISIHGGREPEFVSVLGPGGCFGEMGLFDDQPRSASAHVLEASRLLALDKHRLRGLLASYPGLALGLLRGLSLRVREANDQMRQTRPAAELSPER